MDAGNTSNNDATTVVATVPATEGQPMQQSQQEGAGVASPPAYDSAVSGRSMSQEVAGSDEDKKDFKYEMFDIKEIQRNCVLSCCCTPCVIAETRRRVYDFSENRCLLEGAVMSIVDVALTSGFIGLLMPATSVATLLTRRDLRTQRSYQGELVEDVLYSTFCTQCSTYQMFRELEDEKVAAEAGPQGTSMTASESDAPVDAASTTAAAATTTSSDVKVDVAADDAAAAPAAEETNEVQVDDAAPADPAAGETEEDKKE